MLTAVKCAGSSSFQVRVPGRRSIGSIATTIGSSRTLDSPTAIATSIRLAPAPSVEIRITCAGPAHTSRVEASAHVTREAEIMRERADADVRAEQHVAEHRGPGGAEARQIGGRAWTTAGAPART